MDFYTSIERSGNFLQCRGYRGTERIQKKFVFQPTLYVNSKTGSWRTLDDVAVEPMQFDSMRDATEFQKRYEHVSGFDVYGMTNYVSQFIAQKWEGDIQFDPSKISVTTIDIEVASDEGFPEPDKANPPITAITTKNS